MTSVLFVISAADRWTLNDGEVHPSGYWGEEVAVPHRIFADAGWDITIATPGGHPPTLDKLSIGRTGGMPGTIAAVKRYLNAIGDQLDHPVVLADVNALAYDLVFYPGGHGPMEDLAHDKDSGRLLTQRLESGKPLALLCHAPAAILATRNADGSSPFRGYRMTACRCRLNTDQNLLSEI